MGAVTVDAALALFAGRTDESDFLASIADPIERWEAKRQFHGSESAVQKAYDEGYAEGYAEGEADGIDQGKEQGYDVGHEDGVTEGIDQGKGLVLAYLESLDEERCPDALLDMVRTFVGEG